MPPETCSLAGDTIDQHFAPTFKKSFPSIAMLLERSTLVTHLLHHRRLCLATCSHHLRTCVDRYCKWRRRLLASSHAPLGVIFLGRDGDGGLGNSRTRESLRAGEPQTVRRYREGCWLNARYRRRRMAMTVAARSPYSQSRRQRS